MSRQTFSVPMTESLLEGLTKLAEPTGEADIFYIPPPSEPVHPHFSKPQIEDADDESEESFKERLTECFKQMMFVSGETAEPSAETTGMIEELVKQQVIEMVRHSVLIPSKGYEVSGLQMRPSWLDHS